LGDATRGFRKKTEHDLFNLPARFGLCGRHFRTEFLAQLDRAGADSQEQGSTGLGIVKLVRQLQQLRSAYMMRRQSFVGMGALNVNRPHRTSG
jgi:hypothetical protein